MCGIFGWYEATNETESTRSAWSTVLMLKNDGRGGDGYGYWTPTSNPVRGLGKISSNIPAPILAKHKTLIGHTRFATCGGINIQSCHPFEYDTLVGCHNGMIYNADDLDYDYPDRGFLVDSQHIFAHIADEISLQELEGYGAIVYTDANNPGIVYLGRFQGGQLSIARLKRGGFVWSSALDHLTQALHMSGADYSMYRLAEGRLYKLEGGQLRRAGYLPVSSGTVYRWDQYGCGFTYGTAKPASVNKATKRAVHLNDDLDELVQDSYGFNDEEIVQLDKQSIANWYANGQAAHRTLVG